MLTARAAADQADVGGRLLVDPAERHLGDRARGGGDRRAPLLGDHAGVGGAPVEADLELLRRGRAQDHLADRRGAVVDVADARAQPRVVEGERRRARPTSSFEVNRSSIPACGRPSASTRRVASSIADDRRLVVGAEDRRAGVADDPVVDDRLDGVGRGHRVEVGAEEERLPRRRRLERDVDVAHGRADARRRSSSSSGVEPAVARGRPSTRSATARSSPEGLGRRASSQNRSSTSEATASPC